MLMLDRTFMHQGNRVAWTTLGSGPALVLIHGTPFSAQVWRRIAPLLAAHWQVYAFDLIGYGQSDMREGQDVSLGVQNGLLAALLAHWGLDRPDVLAHDFGGATALRGYYLNGLRYRRLTLIDPVALAPWGSPLIQHVRRHEAAFAGLPDYAHEALLRAYITGAVHRPLTEAALQVHCAPWLGETGKRAFYRQIAQMDQSHTRAIEPFYGAIDADVHVLWGECDAWIPVAQAEALAARLTGSRLTRVPEAGHLVQEDAPEAIIAAMLAG